MILEKKSLNSCSPLNLCFKTSSEPLYDDDEVSQDSKAQGSVCHILQPTVSLRPASQSCPYLLHHLL